jgi:CzcA family heavy metal efflux pump
MLDAIIRFSLRHRLLVVASTALILVYGWVVLQRLPVDVFPDLNRPTVNVITDIHGMAPEEVEVVVTRPIETVLNGMPGVTRIYSSSTTGLSVIRAEFDWGTDLRFARLAVSERLQLTRERLPKEAAPILSPTSSIMGEIQMIGLSAQGGDTDLGELRALADWTIRPRLLTLPGVSQVIILGGDQKQAQVLVNAERLRKKQLSMLDLEERVSRISAASGGGFLTSPDGQKEWLIRNVGRVLNHEEIATTAIGMHFGIPVLLKDVAQVDFAPAPKRGDASINASPGVVLMIQKQMGADTVRLSNQIDHALEDLKPGLPSDIQIRNNLFKQADFIQNAIGNVKEALRDGSIMVMIVLVLFLLNFRTTVITLTAIPVSLLITAIVFHLFDVGINTMTLGGLAIAIGELVDDAIVDVENVFRRLRENRQSPSPKPTLRVIYSASSEVRNSIVLATIIVVLVFIPLFALSGMEGRLFTPIGIAYVISLLASLGVSLTLTPVLCSYLLSSSKGHEEKDGWLVGKLKALQKRILRRTLEHPVTVILGAAIGVVIACASIPFMGQNFLPSFNEGSAMVELDVRAGISLQASSELAMKVERALLSIPEVLSTGRRTGRAEEDDHAAGVNHSEFEVLLKPSLRSRAEIVADIRDRMKEAVPAEAYFSVSQPITHRLDHVLSGVKSQVALKLFGPDLRVLRQQGAEIREAIKTVPGIVDLRVDGQALFPQYKIYGMRPDLARYGITPGNLIESLESMLQGVPVTRIIEKDRTLEVFLRLDESSRDDIESIKSLPAHVLPTGQVIPLGEVADIFETSGPNMIERENLQRRIAIPFNTQGRDLEAVVRDVKKKIAEKIKLPQGYFLEYSGQYESQKHATRMVFILGILSVLGIFIVLFAHFKSIWVALQIMVNIPLALVGAVLAIFLTDRTFSVATLVAFITLCGIASRNGIMMISHYLHLMKEEGEAFSKDMVIRGSLERLVPVLMTAFSAILALMPLVLAKDEAGKEILHPVAVVIVGGLLSSTLLDIFVTPAIFYRFGRRAAERLVNKQPEDLALGD